MNNFLTKAGLSLALGATALAVSTPAEAQRYRGGRGYDRTGAAVVAGVAGLAVGAALASGGHRYYYDDYPRPYYRPYYRSAYPYSYPVYPYAYRGYAPVYYGYPGYRGYRGGYWHGGGWHGGGRGFYGHRR